MKNINIYFNKKESILSSIIKDTFSIGLLFVLLRLNYIYLGNSFLVQLAVFIFLMLYITGIIIKRKTERINNVGFKKAVEILKEEIGEDDEPSKTVSIIRH